MSLFETVKRYANGIRIATDWLGSGGEVVDEHLAQTRANTCLTCPKNTRGIPLGEEAGQFVREQLQLKNHLDMKVIGEKDLHSCEICCCYMPLKIWCPMERIRPRPEDKFPDYCWLMKESK